MVPFCCNTFFFNWNIGIFYRLLLDYCSSIGCLLLTIPLSSFILTKLYELYVSLQPTGYIINSISGWASLGVIALLIFCSWCTLCFHLKHKRIVLYIKKILPKFLLQVYDVWIWCLMKLLKCRMMALWVCVAKELFLLRRLQRCGWMVSVHGVW